ncbi:hypothetical protein FSARC_11441 [Fusarium sarcochroum]|uniref:Uncharacterized protein n=1 Tax=Fusarium sarcochroum TaxID=1208366 RepID=A0A8H4TFN5_9HYPO|nr:hypothetical protein FSARC_11441 [Fusarium sarcochroum]
MVSFFGLKLGGDRKKSQDKQKLATRQIQHLHRNEDDGSITPKDERRLTKSNFSRPNLTRPGTSSSQLEPPTRTLYMGGSGGASSMVDLGAPRAPGMGNPRFHSSDANLNTRFGNGSSTSLAAPGPISANRSDTPTRPGTAVSTREPENPFNIHFGKDSVSSIPTTPMDEPIGHEHFKFNHGDDNTKDIRSKSPIPPANNGYPSPPPSILNAERSLSPDNRPSSSRQNAPTAPSLRNPSTAGPMSLPSPAVSVARSEDTWDAPVIRNVTAKRDTFTFHTPRRQSFAMEMDEPRANKPMVEGLAGNFAGFDFGDTVRKGSIGSKSVETSIDGGMSPTDTNAKPRALGTTRTASPLRTMQSSPVLSLSMSDSGSTRARNLSDAMSPLSLVASAEDIPRIQTPQPSQQAKTAQQLPKILQPGQLSEPLQNVRPVSPSRSPQPSPLSQPPQQQSPQPSPILSQFPGRQPSPPLESYFPRSPPRSFGQSLQPSPQQPPKQYRAYQPPNSSPPTRPLPSPYRSPTAPLPPIPPPRLNPGKNSRSNTPDGSNPGYMSRPLDPPPRMRPRTDSDPQLTRPLRVPAPHVDRSATIPFVGADSRSAISPGFDEKNYLFADHVTPEPPRTASPFSQRSPIEGEFPVEKGLPRGRKLPTNAEVSSPERNFGLEPRKQRRQPPMYPPPRNMASPAFGSQQKESLDQPGTPNWNDFDRAEAHRSAIPAALSPFRGEFPLRSPTQATDDSLSPRLAQYASSPISDTPPSLPSPSFPSLQKSISNSSENLARSFDMTADGYYDQQREYQQARPLISPVMADFVPPRDRSATRVEAKRAPPRPSPITVPRTLGTGPETTRVRTPNPVVDAFNPGFI